MVAPQPPVTGWPHSAALVTTAPGRRTGTNCDDRRVDGLEFFSEPGARKTPPFPDSALTFFQEVVMATKLRAVAPGETAKPAKKLSVTEAAAEGSLRELLVAMRDRVAKDVESPNTPARDLAALTRRLMEITKEIEAIDAKGESDVDNAPTPDAAWGSC